MCGRRGSVLQTQDRAVSEPIRLRRPPAVGVDRELAYVNRVYGQNALRNPSGLDVGELAESNGLAAWNTDPLREMATKTKTRTVKRSELHPVLMGGKNGKKDPAVINHGNLMRWVGIGWVNEGKATTEDKVTYHTVIDT